MRVSQCETLPVQTSRYIEVAFFCVPIRERQYAFCFIQICTLLQDANALVEPFISDE